MEKIMKNRSLLGFVLALFVALVVYLLQDAFVSNAPESTKVAELGEELKLSCQANEIELQVQLMHNNVLVKTYKPEEFIQSFAQQETSIPYDKKERGIMYPLIELFDIKENTDYVQLLTCAHNQKIMLSREDILLRPDPLYWMSKRKGFLSVHSMIYDETTDTSVKTDFKARPILVINLIDSLVE
jgi:hypothetical protein